MRSSSVRLALLDDAHSLAMSMNGTSESGFWSESLLMAWSGSVPDKDLLDRDFAFLTAKRARNGVNHVEPVWDVSWRKLGAQRLAQPGLDPPLVRRPV